MSIIQKRWNKKVRFLRLRFVESLCCVWEESTAWLEWFLSVAALVVGLFVVLPFQTTSPPFSVLGRICPETLWGAILFGMGLCQWSVACRNWLCGQALSSICGALIWLFLAVLTWMKQWNAIAGVLYALLCVGWFIVLFKMPLEPFDRAQLWWERLHSSSDNIANTRNANTREEIH